MNVILLLLLILIILLAFPRESSFVEIDDKIDVVYTWVDGNDPKWIAKKTFYTGTPKSDNDYRYITIDELKYSLRSLYQYAPWVNTIYIVVDDEQVPSFVNQNNPKIKIIKHSEIIPKEYLPVFNSVAIEANIHHIPELQENFLYFNDDVFFGNYVTPKDVFNICYYEKVKYTQLKPEDDEWICNVKNNYLFLKQKFPETKYIVPHHQFHFCKKSLMYDLENMFPEAYTFTSKQKLRKSYDDTVVCQSINLPKMQFNYGVLKNIYKMIPERDSIYVEASNLTDQKTILSKLEKVKQKRPKFFCINNNLIYSNIIIQFLNTYFPDKSPYEK
jgi:hypothetical protein